MAYFDSINPFDFLAFGMFINIWMSHRGLRKELDKIKKKLQIEEDEGSDEISIGHM